MPIVVVESAADFVRAVEALDPDAMVAWDRDVGITPDGVVKVVSYGYQGRLGHVQIVPDTARIATLVTPTSQESGRAWILHQNDPHAGELGVRWQASPTLLWNFGGSARDPRYEDARHDAADLARAQKTMCPRYTSDQQDEIGQRRLARRLERARRRLGR